MIEIDTGTQELLCRIEDRVGVITLNKPHKKNALGDILTPALRRALVTLEDDDRVGSVMITGAGDAFCSGGDVGGMGGGSRDDGSTPLSGQDAIAELVQKQQSLRDSLVLEAEHMLASFRDPEAREAISAFMEKRAPSFHGNIG